MSSEHAPGTDIYGRSPGEILDEIEGLYKCWNKIYSIGSYSAGHPDGYDLNVIRDRISKNYDIAEGLYLEISDPTIITRHELPPLVDNDYIANTKLYGIDESGKKYNKISYDNLSEDDIKSYFMDRIVGFTEACKLLNNLKYNDFPSIPEAYDFCEKLVYSWQYELNNKRAPSFTRDLYLSDISSMRSESCAETGFSYSKPHSNINPAFSDR